MAYLENIRTFVRVYELGNMSAAARDQRISAAVTSARIAALEEHLNIRLFQRTTRTLHPTEQGRIFYRSACKILEAVDEAEAEISTVTDTPRGSLFVAAPLGLGQRIIAPAILDFRAEYPLIKVRLRLSDRKLDLAGEGLDAAIFLGVPEDSSLKIRKIADCERVLCAAPDYIARKDMPRTSACLQTGAHDCLNLRFPGATEFRWPLQTPTGVQRIAVTGALEADHSDVLTDWALAGQGIILKPVFEVAEHLAAKRLVPVLQNEPPVPIQLACLYSHRRKQDPKTRLLMDFMAARIKSALNAR